MWRTTREPLLPCAARRCPRAIAYSMAVLEVNASMGLIVAAPTAGSAGVLPGVLLAIRDTKEADDEMLLKGLLNASAVGYILMRNASVSRSRGGLSG